MGKWREKEEKKEDIKYILSIDGGGMRGIIPIYIISHLNDKLRELGDRRPFYSHFDLISGTSTGSLIALALADDVDKTSLKREKGDDFRVITTEKTKRWFKTETKEIYLGDIKRLSDPLYILEMYESEGKNIFKTSDPFKKMIGTIIGDRYDGVGFDDFLNRTFKDSKMSDMLTPTMVVSFDPYTSEPFIFKSWEKSYFYARDAARASSSAPTYFPPARIIDTENKKTITLVDGGIAANNPALLAYSEARKLYPNADKFRILSLSTGSPRYSINPLSTVGGAAGWAGSIWQSYSSGSMAIADILSSSIKDVEYTRIWTPMKEKLKLDDTSDEAIEKLEKSAENMLRTYDNELRAYLSCIRQNGNPEKLRLIKDQTEIEPLLP